MSEQETETTLTDAAESQEQPQGQAQEQQPVQQEQQPQQEQQEQQPVEYTEFGAPEGVTLDQDALGEFQALAGDARLSQEQAQKVVDIGVKMQQKWATEQANTMQAARDQWEQSSRTDQEFGGDKLDANLGLATKALDKFGTPALRQLLIDSGLGNHPEVIRLLYRTGKAISDDRFVGGGNGPGPARTPANVMFPTMK